jgi:MFS family permease
MKKIKLPFNHSLRVLLCTNALILIALALLGPIYAIFVREQIGGTVIDVSMASAICYFVAGMTTFISGRYADKVKDGATVLVIGYMVMGFGFFSYLWAVSIPMLFLIQGIIGMGLAIYSPVFNAMYSDHLDKNKETLEWSAWESVNYFTAAIGAVLGGVLVNAFGFKVVFVIMTFLCIGSALYILGLPKKTF